ncbi:MAG: hypothetical protein J6S60_09045 [Oscillospiraceae bacterium]|nr:hypothetical protein [Oscillospiraceae bacterium]
MARAKTEQARKKRITTEFRRISAALESVPTDRRTAAEKLMQEAAYMTEIIADAKEEIDAHGIIEEYQNGENQFGRKKSPAVEIYDRAVNSYAKVIKQLTDLMPDKSAAQEAGAALRAFLDEGG